MVRIQYFRVNMTCFKRREVGLKNDSMSLAENKRLTMLGMHLLKICDMTQRLSSAPVIHFPLPNQP